MRNLLLILFTIFLFNVKSNADVPDGPNFQYENRIGFNFPLFGFFYDRIKPNSYYMGMDAGAVAPTSNLSSFAHVEMRGGYHFFDKAHHHFIPILGSGYYHIEEGLFPGHEDKPDFVYTSLGFLYEYESFCNIGLNAQGLLAYRLPDEWYYNSRAFGKISSVFPVFGFKGSVPITFRFGKKKNWDFKSEPFFLYFSNHKVKVHSVSSSWFGGDSTRDGEIKKHVEIAGLRLSVGYRF